MRIRKTFKFEAAHRLGNSYTKRCQGIHGHSYKVEVILDGVLDLQDGMVMDFTLLKEKIGKFIDRFDHSLILSATDPLIEQDKAFLWKLNPRYIITPYEPTAEGMAAHIFAECYQRLASHKLVVTAVRVHETETGYAECSALDDLAADFSNTFFSEECMR